jgi:hypothetical protein
MSEEVSLPVLNFQTGKSSNVTFFLDDTIETVRSRLGALIGIHPDRLRMYVEGQFDGDYYAKDSRKWEDLFLRMSPEGKPVRKGLVYYNKARNPPLILDSSEYDKSGWMAIDSRSDASFRELRILGVPEERSWVFPLDNSETPEHLPPAGTVSIDMKELFQTHHPYAITQFLVIPHSELLPQLEVRYYPRFRADTPGVVPPDVVRAIARQSDIVTALTTLPVTQPDKVSIVKALWKLPLVDTDFGNAPRNRFEQIFYGTTLSESLPVVSFFSSLQQQSRHKFFTEAVDKTPTQDVRTWKYWWDASKPTRNKPALLFYRGTSRHSYDRISVFSTEIVISCSRTDDSADTHLELQKIAKEFLLSIDGLAPFLDPADYEDDRWVLQDMSGVAHFDHELKEADFRRFDCLRSIYEIYDRDKLIFKFLRSSQTESGLSDTQARIVGLLNESAFISAEQIVEQIPELSVTDAASSLQEVQVLLSENPKLSEQHYSYLPTFKFSAKQVIVTHAADMKRILRYISALREVLMNPDNKHLDGVCPKRVEVVEQVTAVAPPIETDDGGESADYLDDLFGELEGATTSSESEKEKEKESTPEPKKVKTKGATTLYTYLLTQLREFDPDTYDPNDPEIPSKCDRPRQPVIYKKDELKKFDDDEDLSQYDPRGDGRLASLEVKDPDGLVICPKYWCVTDRIPLKEEQLVDNTCPICGGKIRSNDKKVEKTQDVLEFSVLYRESSNAYPGFVKYKSKKGKQVPCCFATAQTTKMSYIKPEGTAGPISELFYILGETKTRLEELRLAYIPKQVGTALKIPIDYRATMDAMNRIQSGQGGFFRAGLGHPSETLPKVLNISHAVHPPSENPEVVRRCSFFRTWKLADDLAGSSDKVEARVRSIDKAYREKTMSKLEELEYSALFLNCMVYIIYVGSEGLQSGCFMNVGAVKMTSRAVLVLIDAGDSDSADYVSNVSRTSTAPVFNGNLYNKLFPKQVRETLETLRITSCVLDIPTIDKAITFLTSTPLKDRMPEFKIILDPYSRAQALYLPKTIILPFRPTSQIPTFLNGSPIHGYADISQDNYPQKTEMIKYLEKAREFHSGYAYAHDNANSKHEVVELITASGLRIPVLSGDTVPGDPQEIMETVHDVGEEALVDGKPDEKAVKLARSITYEAEIFEFLLFQLAKDLEGEDYRDLKRALSVPNPDVVKLAPLLSAWVDDTLVFSEAESPPAFYSKMRSPCDAGTKSACTGLCVWDGASCRVQVKTVREGLRRKLLESRLLSTLSSNDKIRTAVFDHRISPFFSSILYLELPSEIILSDGDVAAKLKQV